MRKAKMSSYLLGDRPLPGCRRAIYCNRELHVPMPFLPLLIMREALAAASWLLRPQPPTKAPQILSVCSG